MNDHVVLSYRVSADGVWLECVNPDRGKLSCGWWHHLEFGAAPNEAKRIADEHMHDPKAPSL